MAVYFVADIFFALFLPVIFCSNFLSLKNFLQCKYECFRQVFWSYSVLLDGGRLQAGVLPFYIIFWGVVSCWLFLVNVVMCFFSCLRFVYWVILVFFLVYYWVGVELLDDWKGYFVITVDCLQTVYIMVCVGGLLMIKK